MCIAIATTDTDIRACYPVMAQLRPHVREEDFLAQVRRMERDGFQLVALRDEGSIQAVAGFRVYENLHAGRILYVDDLVTAQHSRSRGHGQFLLAWLADHARQRGCVSLELDSGTQRVDAHRFYLRERMNISSFHFTRRLVPLPDAGA